MPYEKRAAEATIWTVATEAGMKLYVWRGTLVSAKVDTDNLSAIKGIFKIKYVYIPARTA